MVGGLEQFTDKHVLTSLSFRRGSRVEGSMSRVEGTMSRVEGTMSRFEGNFVFPRKIKPNLTKIIKYK